ncbi:MAG: hypothetical protein ACREVR_10645 [Burkholderiales bacterium]
MLLHPAAGVAQEMTMAELKDAQKLAGEELRQVLTGAKVKNATRHGSTRYWNNSPDGKFTASSDAQGYKGRPTTYPTTGAGSWHISPLDQYCVTIEWRTTAENWCLFVYKSGDKFYGTSRQRDPSARAVEFEFNK